MMPKKIKRETKQVLPKMHIYCEGEKTEPNYINSYILKFHDGKRRLKTVIVEKTKKNTPVQLVQAALTHKKKCPDNDIFWVVYDREGVAKYADGLHEKAKKMAEKNGIHIALSNVCFELWLLLHFSENTAPYTDFDNLMAASNFDAHLKRNGIQSYSKGSMDVFDKVVAGISLARDRAVMMNAASLSGAVVGVTEPYRLNPYTDMHLLLDAIDIFK